MLGRMKRRNIGFLSFRISGTDGVSLETKKWAEVLERNGHRCFYFAGEVDTPDNVSMVAEEAHFQTPVPLDIYRRSFQDGVRPEALTRDIHSSRVRLKKELRRFIEVFSLDVLVPQNTLTIPLNPPLAMAITEVIAETGIATIAHHHDFFWERTRFINSNIPDILQYCYPPRLPSVEHVVINSAARDQVGLRTGIAATLIPNVMDFARPPQGIDEYNRDVRAQLGIAEDELLVLQPTRVVQRKGIEQAIELVARLGKKARLVISHASGDEGYEYEQRVREFAGLLGVHALFVDEQVDEQRGTTSDGRKVYRLQDLYPHADLVTYPSLYEGFGNAFLEAVYFRKPLVVNNYSIYASDIRPKGFRVIEFDNFISARTVEETKALLSDPQRVQDWVDHNYTVARRFFSYEVLEARLNTLLGMFYGEGGRAGG